MLTALAGFVLASCGTGIEDTTRVTDKDVKRVEIQYAQSSVASSIKFERDSVAQWKARKRFYVADDQARLIFQHSLQYDADSLRLGGKYIEYQGHETGSVLDNTAAVILKFTDGAHILRYNTNKTLDQLRAGYSVPFLIDNDMVRSVGRQLEGRTLFTRTRIWYDADTQKMIDGRQFVAVKIDSVLPGDKVLPLKVVFTTVDTHERAMLRMAEGTTMKSRDFDSMFSRVDPKTDFPDISPDNWTRITQGVVALGMTKQECRLAKGAPKQVSQLPSQDGLREYWYYDGGTYLYLQDGVLKEFRR